MMEDKHRYLDDLFREELGGYHEQPDAAVWNKLEERLHGRRKKRITVWWWLTGIALLVSAGTWLATGGLHTPAENPATAHSNHGSSTPVATFANHSTPSAVVTHAAQPQQKPTSTNTSLPAAHKPAATSAAKLTNLHPVAGPAPVSATNTDNASITTITMPVIENKPYKPLPAAEINTTVVAAYPITTPATASTTPTEEWLLPTAGSPKKQPITDISQYEPLITRSKHQRENMLASTNSMAPVTLTNTTIPQATPPVVAIHDAAPPEKHKTDSIASPTDNPMPKQRRAIAWSYGAKTGYEISTNKYSAGNGIIGGYIQASISQRISVLVQPTIKYASLRRTALDKATPYYDVKNNSTTALHIITPDGADPYGNPVYNIIRRYFYAQQYDSVAVTKTIRPRSYTEFELPLILQYKITKQLSVTAGISANFSKLVQVERDEMRFAGKMRYDTLVFAQVNENSPAPPIPGIETRIRYNYAPYKDFMAGEKLNADNNPVRFNYMFGLSYALKNGLNFDLLMLSMLNNANYIPDERIRQIYKQPYIRIGVGYQLGKYKK